MLKRKFESESECESETSPKTIDIEHHSAQYAKKRKLGERPQQQLPDPMSNIAISDNQVNSTVVLAEVTVDDNVDDDHQSNQSIITNNDEKENNFQKTATKPKRVTASISTSKSTNNRKGQKRKIGEDGEFVIHTRDNNLPNPFGTTSTTGGKLPWQKVAELYNAKYNKNVIYQAVEKRYRTKIEQYYNENPTYPRSIIYTGDTETSKRMKKPTFVSEAVESVGNNVSTIASSIDLENDKGDQGDSRLQQETVHWRDGYGAMKPPHDVTEAADARNYFNLSQPIKESEYPDWVVIEVEDDWGRSGGTCNVPLRDIRRSSEFYAEYLKDNLSIDISLQGVEKKTLSRYVDCISPLQRATLPQHDFDVARYCTPEGLIELQPVIRAIFWDFEALVDLYVLAAQLQDKHVRNLVMDHWRVTCQTTDEIEIDANALNRLFAYTEEDDTARMFWVLALLYSDVEKSITPQDQWHPHLIAMLMKAECTTPPWLLSHEELHDYYHCSNGLFLAHGHSYLRSDEGDYDIADGTLLATPPQSLDEFHRPGLMQDDVANQSSSNDSESSESEY